MNERLNQIYLNKAILHKISGHPDVATQLMAELLESCPEAVEPRSLLAACLVDMGDYTGAVSHINQFPSNEIPETALALAKLGQALADKGAYQQAVSAFRASLGRIEPNPAIWNNLGLSLIECGCSDEANLAFIRALALDPDSPEYHNNFGNLCVLRFEMGLAVEHFRRALELNPSYQNAFINLGRTYRLCGDMEASQPLLMQAVAMNPGSQPAVDNLLSFLNYSEEDGEKVASEHMRLAPFAYPGVPSYQGEQHFNSKPRIGFVSPDFRTHPVAYFFEPILKYLDRTRFELYCYSQVSCPDSTTERLFSYGGNWRSTVGCSDEQVAQLVKTDRIDILVDLAGYTEGHRLGAFALRPAPVQCSWLGYPNTTGLPQIDYRITDAVADPPGKTDTFHTEKLIRLPHIFLTYTPDDSVATAPLAEGPVTFCCFNNLSKISDKTLLLWAAIMDQLPSARLLLKFAFLNEEFARSIIRQRLVRHDIDLSRVDMHGFTATREDHLAMYGKTHIALDTYPYNGTTTTCEALWMGVPVVTLAGNSHVSRVGASILTAIDCKELVAENGDDYIARAVALANDRAALHRYRATLRSHMKDSPLTDTRRFVAGLEQAFEGMMSGHSDDQLQQSLRILACKGLTDEAIDLAVSACQQGIQAAELLAEAGDHLTHGGDEQLAVKFLRQALVRLPDQPALLFSLASACTLLGDYQEAARHLKTAARMDPGSSLIRSNLGYVLERLGILVEAEEQYRAALCSDPGNESAAVGYANLLAKRMGFVQAVQLLRNALQASPESPKICFCLANHLLSCGEAERAIIYYLTALELGAEDRGCIDNTLYTLNTIVKVNPHIIAEELEHCSALPELMLKMTRSTQKLLSLTPARVAALHRELGGRNAGSPPTDIALKPALPYWPERRIRVGYISADLHGHPVGFFLEGVLLNHQRDHFEIFIFTPMQIVNELTDRLRQAAEHWIVLDPANRRVAREQVRECAVDILFDMAGHTSGNYLDFFAGRLAPVQISWGGYPSTTGIPSMDYILADDVALPPAEEAYYTEKPLRMPEPFGYVCIVPPQEAPDPEELPALAAGHVTFGCFNGIYKYNELLLETWSELLKALPSAKLFIKSRAFGDADVCSLVARKFVGQGVDPSRIQMEGYSPRAELLKTYQQVDIALDPFPYQGGMTVLEAAWMGVPTLVLQGSRPPFIRHGESHLHNIGFSHWVARSVEEYIDKAITFSQDLPALQAVRQGLRERMSRAPVSDAAGFTRAFEGMLLNTWKCYRGDACSR